MFHLICSFQGIIGKRFRDAGLRDLAIESEVIAEGSVDSVIDISTIGEFASTSLFMNHFSILRGNVSQIG